MNNILFYDNFVFHNIKFTKYHYTDNTKGSPHNYIAYMHKGHSKIISDEKTININSGDIFFIPKGLPYQSYWHGEDEIEFFSYGFNELDAGDFYKYSLQVFTPESDLANKLISVPTNGNYADCRTLGLFYDAMAEIIPHLETDSANNNELIIKKIKSCIRKYPHLTMREISQKCSISEPYMYSLFKKTSNTTPNEYRRKVLCEMATELLLTTNKSIEEISGILNFSSSSYFRKVLKKYTGLTPGEIRRSSVY